MKNKTIQLSQIKANSANPRNITGEKFNLLIASVLTFPKMLDIREVVLDNSLMVLGGNMRYRALLAISKMDEKEVRSRLSKVDKFSSLKKAEQEAIVKKWLTWIDKPTVNVKIADDITAEEKQEFIIKDNVAYGTWDYDALANGWDGKKLGDWALDVWQTPMQGFDPSDTHEEQRATPTANDENLPAELQGLDLEPDALQKIQGDDKTLMQRVIITFREEDASKLADMLGLAEIEKVVYTFDEIIGA